MTVATYDSIKNSMIAAGLPVSVGSGWNNIDAGSYSIWTKAEAFKAGISPSPYKFNYGFAYAGEMPAIVNTDSVPYTSTLGASPTSGAHPVSVTLTLTESHGVGSSFAWDFGDGNTTTTNNHITTHSYAAAGSYTPKCTPTVNGVVHSQVNGPTLTIS